MLKNSKTLTQKSSDGYLAKYCVQACENCTPSRKLSSVSVSTAQYLCESVQSFRPPGVAEPVRRFSLWWDSEQEGLEMRAYYLVYIISCIFLTASCLKILKSSVFSKHLVKEGHSLSLQCDADAVWFLCVWVSPQGGKMCAIQEEEGGSTQVCQGNPRVTIHGDMNTCSISINNTIRTDRGDWMCLLQEGEEFKTDRTSFTVEVAREASIGLDCHSDNALDDDKRILKMVEGDTVSLSCRSTDAFPQPRIDWSPWHLGNNSLHQKVSEVVKGAGK